MGINHHHFHYHDHVYGDLSKRLDSYPVGAPDTPKFLNLLKALYTEEEARLACRMPQNLTNISTLAKSTGWPEKKLEKTLEEMADRGLVMDLDRNGEKYYLLMPTVPGFLEMLLMRKRDDIPQKMLAQFLDDEREVLLPKFFSGHTQFGRVLPYEQFLPGDDYHQICSYDKASDVINEANAISVSLCFCRHERKLLEDECPHPVEVCLGLGLGAEFIIRHGFGRRIEKAEALDIVTQARELGLVQVADNVQRKPVFLCNCCHCACVMLNAFKQYAEFETVMTSSYIANVKDDACVGCGRCARACPVGAITLKKIWEPKEGLRAEVDESGCLGCGVCVQSCRKGAMSLVPRPERIMTPETTFHRMTMMALERGKLQDLLFADPGKITHRVGRTLMKSFIQLPPVKKTLLQKEVKSKFVNFLFEMAKRSKDGWVLDYL